MGRCAGRLRSPSQDDVPRGHAVDGDGHRGPIDRVLWRRRSDHVRGRHVARPQGQPPPLPLQARRVPRRGPAGDAAPTGAVDARGPRVSPTAGRSPRRTVRGRGGECEPDLGRGQARRRAARARLGRRPARARDRRRAAARDRRPRRCRRRVRAHLDPPRRHPRRSPRGGFQGAAPRSSGGGSRRARDGPSVRRRLGRACGRS